MSALGAALLAQLDADDLRALADRLRPLLELPEARSEALDGWLDTRAAAAYAGCSKVVIQRAALGGELESEQDAGPGGKRWFTRQMIDAWRRGTR